MYDLLQLFVRILYFPYLHFTRLLYRVIVYKHCILRFFDQHSQKFDVGRIYVLSLQGELLLLVL